MNITQSFLVSILAEFSLVMLCVMGVWSFIAIRRRRQDVAAAQALVECVRREEPMQLSRMRDLIARTTQGGNPSSVAERLLEQERNFYKHFIQVYLKRDAKAFATLPNQVKALGESYRKSFLSEKSDGTFSSSQISESDHYLGEESPTPLQELRSLREAHDKLEARLENMQRMIQGYANAGEKDSSALNQPTNTQFAETLISPTSLLPESPTEEAFEMPEEDTVDTSFGAELEFESTLESELEPESTFDSGLEPDSESALEPEEEMERESEQLSGLEFDLKPESSMEPTTESSTELMMEDASMEDFMEGLMDPVVDPSTESLMETPMDEPVAEPEEFSWDNELLSTDVLDFDVLQLEEVSTDRPGTSNRGSADTSGRSSGGGGGTSAQTSGGDFGSFDLSDPFETESISATDSETENQLRSIVTTAEDNWRETATTGTSTPAKKPRKR